MGRIKSPGLFKRNGIWQIDKQVDGHRVRESTGTTNLAEAERYLSMRTEQIRQASIYGVRPKRTFRQAAAKYLKENQHKSSIVNETLYLKQIGSFINDLSLDKIHIGTLQPYIESRKTQGRKTKTINLALGTVRHLLNIAATEWIDENGLTWLAQAPKIKLFPVHDAKKPYPLSWEEQDKLFAELPLHLKRMALFKVNTGCREQEVCKLRWEWEVKMPNLNTSVFIIPAHMVKNRQERLVVLNRIAKSVVDEVRGIHPTNVFTYRGKPTKSIYNSAWINAKSRAELKQVRVHDLKHTFGRRLRAAGVSFEDRQDLLGHKSSRITTHYSAAELKNLIDAANKVCDRCGDDLGLTILETQSRQQGNCENFKSSHKTSTTARLSLFELKQACNN